MCARIEPCHHSIKIRFNTLVLALYVLHTVSNLAVAPGAIPIAHWKSDEASESISTDSSGGGHIGTIVGATKAPGQLEGGLSFDGVNDYVFASDSRSGGPTEIGLDMRARYWMVEAWSKQSPQEWS